MEENLNQRIAALASDCQLEALGPDLAAAVVEPVVERSGSQAVIRLEVAYPAKRFGRALGKKIRAAVEQLPGVDSATVEVTTRITPHQVQPSVQRLQVIKNIIAVSSAKGGVGKSTVSANLALALAAEGARVGMLDADIYGPSQPRMLGVKGRPDSEDGTSFEPMMSYSIQSISVGYLIDEEEPMIWRGPMVTKALQQLLGNTRWKDLDYLIIDMPPGTGDIQLTLSQQVPVAGAVIVTTPQDIATLDARKGLQMFRKVNVPVLGIVENMSMYTCSNCGHQEHIFGSGGGERISRDYGVPMLGSLPLDLRIREHADNGRPTVVADPDGDVAGLYRQIAVRMAAKLSMQATDFTHKMPKIVIKP